MRLSLLTAVLMLACGREVPPVSPCDTPAQRVIVAGTIASYAHGSDVAGYPCDDPLSDECGVAVAEGRDAAAVRITVIEAGCSLVELAE